MPAVQLIQREDRQLHRSNIAKSGVVLDGVELHGKTAGHVDRCFVAS